MNVGRVVLAVGLAMMSVSLPAQSPPRVAESPRVGAALEVVRVWLDTARDCGQLPAVSAAIVHDQDTLWIGGFGYADLGRRVPAGPDTIYSLTAGLPASDGTATTTAA